MDGPVSAQTVILTSRNCTYKQLDASSLQQIVYHMLRYFVKTERLTESADNCGAGTLSNYHIKTLMLWACELKSRSWWTVNLNLVRICVELLHTLSVWLTDTCCPHYFISNCNLLDNSFNFGNVASKRISVGLEKEYLSAWLINNYIRQCLQRCPVYISLIFNDASTMVKLQNVISEIVRWRSDTSLYDMWEASVHAVTSISTFLSDFCLTVRLCVHWMNELAKFGEQFSIYFSAAAPLHVACKISRTGFNDELMNILYTVVGPNVSKCCSVLSQVNTKLNTSDRSDSVSAEVCS